MNRKIYLTILMIATVLCVVIGTLINTGILAKKNTIRHDRETIMTGENNAIKTSDNVEKKKTDDTVNKIIADIEYGDLIIETGDEFKVDYTGSEDLKPEIELKEGTLNITLKNRHNFPNIFFNQDPESTLYITLPVGTEIDYADFDIDLGDIEISGIDINEFEIDDDLGNIVISDCRLGKSSVHASLGDVEIIRCDFRDLSIKEDLGKVYISATKGIADADLDLSTDLGTVKVNDEDQGSKYRVKSDNGIILNVHNNLGDVILEY